MKQPPNPHLFIRSITPTGALPLEVGTITVLLGPHNVGKSEALRDIARLVGNFEPTGLDRGSGEEISTRVVQDVTFVSRLTLDRWMWGVAAENTPGNGTIASGIGPDLKTAYRCGIPAELKNILHRPVLTARSVRTTALGGLMPLRVAYLSADRHMQLVQPVAAVSPLRAPEHVLQALQLDAGARELFDEAMLQLCDGQHVCLDMTERVSLCLRMADAIPAETGDPVRDARSFAALPRLDEQGVGWQSCAAVVLAFLACPGRAVLLDEPAAFLQPDQARRLGAWIAGIAARLGTQVFVATQNPALLTGLFAGAADVSVFRLSRWNEVTRFALVPPEVGKALAGFPLFAVQDALGCLFHEGVVVVPDATDRIVYTTVAERLLHVRGVGFLHAHGARNLAFVARLLRRANLPVCVVAELDLLQAESSFADLVKAMGMNEPPAPWLSTRERLVNHVEGWFDERELSNAASEVESFLDQLKQGTAPDGNAPTHLASSTAVMKWDRLRRGRLAVLPPELRVWVEELLEDLKRIGIFVSPQGRLQGWLDDEAADDKELWFNRVVPALDRGECPDSLRAFVAEVIAHIQASTSVSRTTSGGHGT